MVRKYGVLSMAVFAIVVSALVGGFFGRNATRRRRPTSPTTGRSRRPSARSRPTTSTRSIPSAWSTARLAACSRRSTRTRASWTPTYYKRMRERQEGHYYGLGITIQVIDGDINVVSLFEGTPAYKKGIRRGDIIARIGGEDANLDGRAGQAAHRPAAVEKAVKQAARPEGHPREGRPQAAGLRPADRHRGPARRDQHPVDHGVVHGGRADRLRPGPGFRREHRSRPGRRARATSGRRA